MYSAFADPYTKHVSQSGLAYLLRKEGVTDCFVVGLATDYCVKWTAIDAAKEGFKTWVIQEAIRGVDRGESEKTKNGFSDAGVTLVSLDGQEVTAVKDRK
jgi:nicotinamidase-related amidase